VLHQIDVGQNEGINYIYLQKQTNGATIEYVKRFQVLQMGLIHGGD
jgi:hypothetical protein